MATEVVPEPGEMKEVKGPKTARLCDSVKKFFYVMVPCLLLFAAARNSFHWQVHRLWGATGSFWQSCWDYMYNRWGQDNDLMFSCIGTWLVTMIVFWSSNAFFLMLDLTAVPQFFLKYKIQEDVKIEMPKFWRALKLVLFNQFVIGFPFCFGASYFFILRGSSVSGELPMFPWVLFEMVIFSFVEEFFFYYSHRLLHHPRLYKHIHKIHHEWTAPIAMVSLYAHPVEHFVSNIMPPAIGPILMGSHLATAWLWFSIAIMSTTIAHCGYHLPLFPSPEAHDYHHLKFNQNFGVLGVLDRLHGTDIQFRNSKQYQRHIMLLSLAPLSQTFPSSPKKKPE